MGSRKVFFRPDGKTAYLLMWGKLFIGLLYDAFRVVRIIQEQNSMDFWPLIVLHKPKNRRIFDQRVCL